MAPGNIVPAHNVVNFNLFLYKEATEAHTVPGLKLKLLCINRLVVVDYIVHFKDGKVRFFGTNGIDQAVMCQAVLE